MTSHIGELHRLEAPPADTSGARTRGRGLLDAARTVVLVLLGLGCVSVSLLQAIQAVTGHTGEQAVMTFLVCLSAMPAPALLGYLLTDRHAGHDSPALAGMLLAVAAWLLLFASLVTYAVVPAVVCAAGGWFFGTYALIRYRAGSMAWWAIMMNTTLLFAAVFVATAYLGHAHT